MAFSMKPYFSIFRNAMKYGISAISEVWNWQRNFIQPGLTGMDSPGFAAYMAILMTQLSDPFTPNNWFFNVKA
jgi:hypothetical protein